MSGRKLALFAASVIAAAVLAAPAGASALMFNYEGKGIEKAIKVELEGTINWVTSAGDGIDCHGKVTTEVETLDAKITEVHLETSTCKGTGKYSFCTVTGDSRTGLPWTVVPIAKGVEIRETTFDYTLECPYSTTSFSAENAVATVDNTAAIKTETLSGTGTSGSESATLSGELKVLGAAAGKLSIVE